MYAPRSRSSWVRWAFSSSDVEQSITPSASVDVDQKGGAADEPDAAKAPVGPSEPASEPPPILPSPRKGSLFWRIAGMIRTVRPHIKSALGAFGVFCLLSGAVYTLNDIVDAEADRVHPVKRFRPIASGQVPIALAKAMLVGLVVVAFGGAMLGPPKFVAVAAGYFLLNIVYSFGLKKIAYVDVGCISLGFVLRVLAGGFGTATPISGYMVGCTALLALFLGFGKRRHELAGANASKQRAALEAYSPQVLTFALAATGIATIATYLAYTLDHDTQRFFQNPYLWATTIHPLFGVIRFLQLVVSRPKAESPTQEILRDVPFMMNIVIWVLEVVFIVYNLRPS